MELQISQDRMKGVSKKYGIWSCQSLVSNYKLMIATAGLTHADMIGLTDSQQPLQMKKA